MRNIRLSRLELARELGATHTVNAAEVDPVAAIVELTGGVDASLEASGVPGVLRQAVDVLAPDSLCGLIGAHAQINQAAQDALAGEVVKPVLRMS